MLALLELRGCIISIDAMGCQTEIAQQIVDGGADYLLADYLLAVKSHQGQLYENIQDLFQLAAQEGTAQEGGLAEEPADHRPYYHRHADKGHRRLETSRTIAKSPLPFVGEG